MKNTLLFLTVAVWANCLAAADPIPREALLIATKALADKPSYTWKLAVEAPNEPAGTINGKAERNGPVVLTLARGDQSFDGVFKGGKGAIKTEEGWKPLAEAAETSRSGPGPSQFVARLLMNFKLPHDEVAEVASKTKDLALADGVYSGALTEEAASDLIMYRTRPGANGPQLSQVQGSAKFWLKDGLVSKYEFNLRATMSANGNERELNRTYTTEIKDIGTTKVVVPEEAAKKL